MVWSLVGFLAAAFTMFGFVPQITKIIRTKSVSDVSILTIIQLSIGVGLWIIYGVHLKNLIIIIANAVTLATLIIVLLLCFIYKKIG